MNPCREFRRALKTEGRLSARSEQHLFACPPCRRRSREERVEREISHLASVPGPDIAVPPDFVARVMRGLPATAPAPRRRPAARWAWAAALAIFSVAAGYGYTVWTDSVAAGQQVATSPAPVEDLALLNF
jgi:predicted anti-sigma-YlaC factor YlaD